MATNADNLNEHGNHPGAFTQGVGGHAEYTVWMTPAADKVIHDIDMPPRKLIPIVFLPSVMGSNLRMSKARQDAMERQENKTWKPEDIGAIDTVKGKGYAGVLKNATPAQRQLNFDPDETEGRFDPAGEGKRDVQHWHGEESLIRREDGAHDFEWAFVGTPKDVVNPSEYGAHLYSKVEHNTVGAAGQASVTDEEAVALWDKLLSGLKFRVQVPGAPEGSSSKRVDTS